MKNSFPIYINHKDLQDEDIFFLDPLPLCPWAEAYFQYRCMPYRNWKSGSCRYLTLPREETEHFCDAWDGHYAAVYYYTMGKINLYSIYKEITLKQVIKVSLPRKDNYNNASLSINDPYIVAARFNSAIIFKKNNVYVAIKSVSVTDTFTFGLNLTNRNTKIGVEIAWACLWMKADTVKDTFVINLNDFSTKYIKGKPHLAFNDNVKLIVAWTKSYVNVTSLNGDVLLNLVRDKIRAIDYNNKFLVMQRDSNIEVIDIKMGSTLYLIQTFEKIEFGISNTLILLEGHRTCTLSSLLLENGNSVWSLGGLKGRASDIRFIGSKYLFVIPAFKKDNYCLIDYKGFYIRESVLPEAFGQFPTPLFNETLAFLVVTNEETFDIISFM